MSEKKSLFLEDYWKMRFETLKKTLIRNNFKVYIAQNRIDAKDIFYKDIVDQVKPRSVSWGGSMTFISTGLYHELKDSREYEILDTYDKKISREKMVERRRQSLLVDLYITSTNAVTEDGQLVNLDMIGNRIGGLTFGPKHVVVLVGRNKIVPDIEDAMVRIKDYSAPTNVMRLAKKTPCSKTSFCDECNSDDRICNTWAITTRSFPKDRIKIILINEDLGL
jgi:L-lactate utilization protein LutB